MYGRRDVVEKMFLEEIGIWLGVLMQFWSKGPNGSGI